MNQGIWYSPLKAFLKLAIETCIEWVETTTTKFDSKALIHCAIRP